MRFHIGLSFRWSSIKKVLFPILIGFLAYLGFNGIFDNFNPLGFIQVNALENLDTTYTYNYYKNDIYDLKIDDNITFKEFVEHLKTLESDYYKIIVSPYTYSSGDVKNIFGFTIFTINKSVSSLNINIFGQTNSYDITYRLGNSNLYGYSFNLYNNSISDIYSYSLYQNFLNCYQNNSCSNRSTFFSTDNYTLSRLIFRANNDTSYNVPFPFNPVNLSSVSIYPHDLYYSQVPLVYSNSLSSTSNYLFKKMIVNDVEIGVGDYFPTYLDYIDSLPDEPVEPDTPSDEEVNHKPLFDKIFWFDDKESSKGILTSIYEVLFFYCLTMICFRILTFLKNKRW